MDVSPRTYWDSRKAAQTPVVVDALKKAQMDPLDLVGDEVTALNRKELDMWGKVVRAENARLQ